MTILLIMFGVGVIIMSVLLVLSGKLTGVDLSLTDALIVSAITSAIGLLPGIFGWLLSVVALYFLLKKMTGAPVFPDLILMIVVSKLLTVAAVLAAISFVSSQA